MSSYCDKTKPATFEVNTNDALLQKITSNKVWNVNIIYIGSFIVTHKPVDFIFSKMYLVDRVSI